MNMVCKILQNLAKSLKFPSMEDQELPPITYQNAAFGLALGLSIEQTAKNIGVSRRTLDYKVREPEFRREVHYWRDLYRQTLIDLLSNDLRRSIKQALVASVSKGEGLASHAHKASAVRQRATPNSTDEAEELAQKAEVRQKMLQ